MRLNISEWIFLFFHNLDLIFSLHLKSRGSASVWKVLEILYEVFVTPFTYLNTRFEWLIPAVVSQSYPHEYKHASVVQSNITFCLCLDYILDALPVRTVTYRGLQVHSAPLTLVSSKHAFQKQDRKYSNTHIWIKSDRNVRLSSVDEWWAVISYAVLPSSGGLMYNTPAGIKLVKFKCDLN